MTASTDDHADDPGDSDPMGRRCERAVPLEQILRQAFARAAVDTTGHYVPRYDTGGQLPTGRPDDDRNRS